MSQTDLWSLRLQWKNASEMNCSFTSNSRIIDDSDDYPTKWNKRNSEQSLQNSISIDRFWIKTPIVVPLRSLEFNTAEFVLAEINLLEFGV